MYAAIWWPDENTTMCAAIGGQVRILQQIYIYLVVFPCGYVRILQPVVICTVIFVTQPAMSDVLTTLVSPAQSFSVFEPVDEHFVHDLATKAKSTTSLLDPMPSPLVKSCLPALCPLLVHIINSSLLTGSVPCSLKTAAITAVLKKLVHLLMISITTVLSPTSHS